VRCTVAEANAHNIALLVCSFQLEDVQTLGNFPVVLRASTLIMTITKQGGLIDSGGVQCAGIQAQTAECLVLGELATQHLVVVLNKVDPLFLSDCLGTANNVWTSFLLGPPLGTTGHIYNTSLTEPRLESIPSTHVVSP